MSQRRPVDSPTPCSAAVPPASAARPRPPLAAPASASLPRTTGRLPTEAWRADKSVRQPRSVLPRRSPRAAAGASGSCPSASHRRPRPRMRRCAVPAPPPKPAPGACPHRPRSTRQSAPRTPRLRQRASRWTFRSTRSSKALTDPLPPHGLALQGGLGASARASSRPGVSMRRASQAQATHERHDEPAPPPAHDRCSPSRWTAPEHVREARRDHECGREATFC